MANDLNGAGMAPDTTTVPHSPLYSSRNRLVILTASEHESIHEVRIVTIVENSPGTEWCDCACGVALVYLKGHTLTRRKVNVLIQSGYCLSLCQNDQDDQESNAHFLHI